MSVKLTNVFGHVSWAHVIIGTLATKINKKDKNPDGTVGYFTYSNLILAAMKQLYAGQACSWCFDALMCWGQDGRNVTSECHHVAEWNNMFQSSALRLVEDKVRLDCLR